MSAMKISPVDALGVEAMGKHLHARREMLPWLGIACTAWSLRPGGSHASVQLLGCSSVSVKKTTSTTDVAMFNPMHTPKMTEIRPVAGERIIQLERAE